MTKKIDLTKEEWALILGCLEEKLTKLQSLEWPLNQMAASPFVAVHEKVVTLLAPEEKK